MTCVSVFVLLILQVSAFWPPPYEVKLDDSETFVISEFSDDLLGDEDEMIPVKATQNDEKYYRIHQIALRHNKREFNEKKPRNITKIKEHNFDLDDAVPWQGGFVDKKGNFIQPDNENVYYLNEMAKSLIDSKMEEKRENEKDKDENYDYNNFKAEYNKDVAEAKKQKDTLNYTEVKEDETVGEAIGTVVDFKEAKNCTAEEKKGIGVAAMKCILRDIKTAKSKNSILNFCEKILRIALIWFCVYAIIAIPCWCTRGIHLKNLEHILDFLI
ncbi:hypothetical protein TcasGA2_TC009238 [Tribolium castaneum]|uniref:Uncharacterized protein n=1 Tax=Tribolium castaneum TaxID=7070 RepID=D6WSS2_TRICA|nr:hypothetical protein TcasGA2_TC009238 [Tribolium castaneum]